jgi:hypothetical protein
MAGWRILRIRFAATKPGGLGWLANPADSLCGDETWRSRLAGESCGFALRRRNLAVSAGWYVEP